MKKILTSFIIFAAMFLVSNTVFACDKCGCENKDCNCACHKVCPPDCDCGCHKGDGANCKCKKCDENCDCPCHKKDCKCDENCPMDCDCGCHKKTKKAKRFSFRKKIKCNCEE